MKITTLVLLLIVISIKTYSQNISRVSVTDNFLIIQSQDGSIINQKLPLSFEGIRVDQTDQSIWLKNNSKEYNFPLSGFLNKNGIPYGNTMIQAIAAFSNLVATTLSSITTIQLVSKSSSSLTDIGIPLSFRSGMIEWINPGTGIVTITTSDSKSTIITANFPARSFPSVSNATYSGYTVALSGGATIQWTFN